MTGFARISIVDFEALLEIYRSISSTRDTIPGIPSGILVSVVLVTNEDNEIADLHVNICVYFLFSGNCN